MSTPSFITAITEFFTGQTTNQLALFIISCFAILEYVTFAILVLMTFFNVMINQDATTSIPRVGIFSVIFLGLRSLFVPFLIVGVTPYGTSDYTWLPTYARVSTIVLAIWWTTIMVMPSLTVWYSRKKYGIGNERLLATPDTESYKFIIIVPVYNETIELLTEGVRSILSSQYNRDQIELHIAFDSDVQTPLYRDFIKQFKLTNTDNKETIFAMVNYETHVYIHKWAHGGKRKTQAKTFDYISRKSTPVGDLDKTVVVMTDSDNYLYDNALFNLACNFSRYPKKIAFSGYMSCMSSGWSILNFWRVIQDCEYVSGEINRGFEVLMGTVNCLPGGFTAIRYSAMLKVAEAYFGNLSDDNITDYHRNYLGEDRFLTHLMHKEFPRHSLGFCPSARAKTDPPTNMLGLIKQRRRWLLGAMSNEAYMVTDRVIGNKFPAMITYKTLQMSWKGTTLTQVVVTWIAVQAWSVVNFYTSILPFVLAIGIPFLINWTMVSLTGIRIGHYKVIFMYPIMHVVTAITTFCIDIYTIFTWRKRTWGGLRTTIVTNEPVLETGSKRESRTEYQRNVTLIDLTDVGEIAIPMTDIRRRSVGFHLV